MTSSWEPLLDKWRAVRPPLGADRLQPLPGVSEAELSAFESRFGLRLPASFRRCLQAANGTDDWDNDHIRFWSLEDIAHELSAPGHLERFPFVPFADWLIESWLWVLPLGSNGEVQDEVCTFDSALAPCAPSFVEFIERYVRGEDLSPRD